MIYVGIDIHKTHCQSALMDESGKVLEQGTLQEYWRWTRLPYRQDQTIWRSKIFSRIHRELLVEKAMKS